MTEVFEHPATGTTSDYVGVAGYVRDVQGDWLVIRPGAWGEGDYLAVPLRCVVLAPIGASVGIAA